jgi:hypothetical protein
MKPLRVLTVVAAVLFLCSPQLRGSEILIWDPDSNPDVFEYQDLLEKLGHSTIITRDLYAYSQEYGLDDIGAIFAILAYGTWEVPEDGASILMDFLDTGRGVYIEGTFCWPHKLMLEYLQTACTTCEPWRFKTFTGVTGTFMEGLHYGFPDSIWSSTIEPYGRAEVIFEDDVMCGCVTAATIDPDLKAVHSTRPVMRVVDGDPPNTKREMLRRITVWFGLSLDAGDDPPTGSLPERVTLTGNFPNPFNSSTSIRFEVPSGPPIELSLRIYNVAGQLVRTLADGEFSSGSYNLSWDGRDKSGEGVATGIYFCSLFSPEGQSTLRISLLR